MLIRFTKSRQNRYILNTDKIAMMTQRNETFSEIPEYVIWFLIGTPKTSYDYTEGNFLAWTGDGFYEVIFPEKEDRDAAWKRLCEIMGYEEI